MVAGGFTKNSLHDFCGQVRKADKSVRKPFTSMDYDVQRSTGVTKAAFVVTELATETAFGIEHPDVVFSYSPLPTAAT